MEYFVWFLIYFIIIYIVYYFMIIRKAKYKRKEKIPTEAQYLINLYKLDVKLFSYHKFILMVGLVTSLDISLVATIVINVKGLIWQILFGFIAVVPIIIISFMLLGKYYQHKQTKDNSLELKKEKEYLDKIRNKENKKKSKKKGKDKK